MNKTGLATQLSQGQDRQPSRHEGAPHDVCNYSQNCHLGQGKSTYPGALRPSFRNSEGLSALFFEQKGIGRFALFLEHFRFVMMLMTYAAK